MNPELIPAVNQTLGISLPENIPYEKLREAVAGQISPLITNDFNKLLSLLYRIDINENKLKNMLAKNPGTDAALLIADLVIERQLQKIESRKMFNQQKGANDEEKW
ncbi:MAG: hypothetical protein IPH18_04430 [Chitinophagaceae bacterium]|nr:hypothetical protein [Chitinophagaceae bacterium]MBK8953836.1 hypothetical protein [Chitinophagaceae bacterium]